mmetsp:Transcript_1206/g.3729  ORF Transcript_1206/g.3729 Transcript_1206/m.3729 type:complete len:259 (-) Transcript_1206:530-1306(-)
MVARQQKWTEPAGLPSVAPPGCYGDQIERASESVDVVFFDLGPPVATNVWFVRRERTFECLTHQSLPAEVDRLVQIFSHLSFVACGLCFNPGKLSRNEREACFEDLTPFGERAPEQGLTVEVKAVKDHEADVQFFRPLCQRLKRQQLVVVSPVDCDHFGVEDCRTYASGLCSSETSRHNLPISASDVLQVSGEHSDGAALDYVDLCPLPVVLELARDFGLAKALQQGPWVPRYPSQLRLHGNARTNITGGSTSPPRAL